MRHHQTPATHPHRPLRLHLVPRRPVVTLPPPRPPVGTTRRPMGVGDERMTATTFRRKSGSYWTYTLDGVPKIKGVTTMLKGLSGPPESYFTKYTAGHAVDNWDRLSQMPPSARLEEIAGATRARFTEAAVRGTAVHKLAEALAKGEEVVVPAHLRGHVESAIQF